MPLYGQLVIGPAGAGKSTYCSEIIKMGATIRRSIHAVNMDPAAEYFAYEPVADVRTIIDIDDVLQNRELNLGPNNSLMYCMEYIADNFSSFIQTVRDGACDGDYYLFDCPGQIELFTHRDIMRSIIKVLQSNDFQMCAVFLVDAHFAVDLNHFVFANLSSLSAMFSLAIPYVNVLSKLDLLQPSQQESMQLLCDPNEMSNFLCGPLDRDADEGKVVVVNEKPSRNSLTKAICNVLLDHSMTEFLPYNVNDPETMELIMLHIDYILGFQENEEPRDRDFNRVEELNAARDDG